MDYLRKFSLEGKRAFVVGGLGLIGIEISRALANAGAKTVAMDVQSNKGKILTQELITAGYDFTFHHFDCSEVDKLESKFSRLLEEYHYHNIFINCSYPRTANWGKNSFRDITLTSFKDNVDIHMNSYCWLARLSAEAMVKGGNGGSIIQFGSIYGEVAQDLTVYEDTDMHENMAYSVIKGGISNLSRQMASYYGQFNIRVNTLCPGGIEIDADNKSKKHDPIFVRKYKNKTPLKRMGRAEEIASAALFLASDASSYITGSTIMVDGGWTAI